MKDSTSRELERRRQPRRSMTCCPPCPGRRPWMRFERMKEKVEMLETQAEVSGQLQFKGWDRRHGGVALQVTGGRVECR